MDTLSPAPIPTAARFAQRRRRQQRAFAATLLVLILLLIITGSLLGQRLLMGTATVAPIPVLGAKGPFVQPPLNTEQLDALRNLVSRMSYQQLASMYVQRMTLDEELGQLIMVEYNDTYYSPDLDTMITRLHAGGVIMYEFQMQTFDQTKHDIAQMQQHASIPLLISTDEEGGIVHRLINIYPPRPSALAVYETGDPNVAAQQGHLVAHDLLALGINTNLAPDVDVALIPNAPDQVTRTFGFTVNSVIDFAGPYLKAMQGDGVIGTIKHFPGLGDASIDAHFGLPVVNRTKEQLYAVELAPFKHFIQSSDPLERPGIVMPTDVLMPAIDPTMPAELSHIFITDILRKQFGYNGVVLTDALYMQGISKTWSMPEAAVLALNAGDDMLLGPTGADQMQAMLDGLKAAVANGTLPKWRIDQAATRIIALKMQDHLMPAIPPQ
jgi:beta-N-acetylhexosaminidase